MTAPLPPFIDTAPADRFCDIVLTGGITSGVVYPPATIELARRYRFRNIGGASAGAMAAALTAAAEYRRCKDGSGAGFDVLGQIPGQLAKKTGGKTTLLSLFHPAPETRRLFRLFLGLLSMRETDGDASRGLNVGLSFLWAYRLPASVGFVVVLALMAALAPLLGAPGSLGAILAFSLGASIAVVRAFYLDITRGLVGNNFGLCIGAALDRDPEAKPAIVEWLHKGIQAAAGLPADKPLTFEDLQDAPWKPPDWLTLPASGDGRHRINLQMVTTNLTHGRPYRLPLTDTTSRLYFKESELQAYFPESVLRELVANSEPYRPKRGGDPPCSDQTQDLRELPEKKLPVVVAARLSLSFPFLFSAVPLWAVDYERRPDDRKLARCWFSDGGISSNFPIHFFDALLPRWPTFGISLGRRSKHWEDQPVWLPELHSKGRGDNWNRFDAAKSALGRLGGFTAAIISSAKDWTDNTAMRMPGVRDRVVRIGFGEGEGELNLDMKSKVIERIASDYGRTAGRLLAERFAPEEPTTTAASGWDEHRWVRFNTLLNSLRKCVVNIGANANGERLAWATPIAALIKRAHVQRPLAGSSRDEAALSAGQADALDRLFETLEQLEATFKAVDVAQPYRPDPAPELRSRPPL